MKTMIQPVNGHLLIQPLKHEAFITSSKETYEEIGIVLAIYKESEGMGQPDVRVGDKVYFDAWLASKYPKNDTEFYWLVHWSDVRATEQP